MAAVRNKEPSYHSSHAGAVRWTPEDGPTSSCRQQLWSRAAGVAAGREWKSSTRRHFWHAGFAWSCVWLCVWLCVRPRKHTLGYSRAERHWPSLNRCFYYLLFYKSFTTPSWHVCYSLALKRQFNTSVTHQKHTLFRFDSLFKQKRNWKYFWNVYRLFQIK